MQLTRLIYLNWKITKIINEHHIENALRSGRLKVQTVEKKEVFVVIKAMPHWDSSKQWRAIITLLKM